MSMNTHTGISPQHLWGLFGIVVGLFFFQKCALFTPDIIQTYSLGKGPGSPALKIRDTTYYTGEDSIVEPENATFYEVVGVYQDDPDQGVVWSYFAPEGKIRSEAIYTDLKAEELARRKSWHPNGTLSSNEFYEDGKKHGKQYFYRENGDSLRVEKWEEGDLIKGTWWDPENEKVLYTEYEEMPEFPGGKKALFDYLREHTEYPPEAEKNGVEGKVVVQFILKKTGEIENVKVKKSVSEALDQEAKRVIRNMPRWEPGRQQGAPVRVSYRLPILFKL